MAKLRIYTDASYCQHSKEFKFASLFYVDGIKVYQFVSQRIKAPMIKGVTYAETIAVLHCVETVRKNISSIKYFDIKSVGIYNDCEVVKSHIKQLKLDDIVSETRKLVSDLAIHKIRRHDKHIALCKVIKVCS